MATSAGADVARASDRTAPTLRRWLLGVTGGDLGLLAVRAATYPAFFSMPGAASYLIAPVVALAVYAAAVGALPLLAARVPGASRALRVGTLVGLAGGGTGKRVNSAPPVRVSKQNDRQGGIVI